jgi:hypothetical protein
MAKDKGGKRGGQARATDRYTKINQHKREGGTLVPPLAALQGLKPSSWLHERLPDMLWCAILIAHLQRDLALEIFRRVARVGKGQFQKGRDFDLSLTGIADLPRELATRIVELVCSAPGAKECLRALLLLTDLPARELWASHISEEPGPEDWVVLGRAVAVSLDHQSQEATDCRWARFLFKVVGGQMMLQSEQQVRELIGYPNEGDQRRVRPFIRASEIADNPFTPMTAREEWAKAFWAQCLHDTQCERMLPPAAGDMMQAGTTLERVVEVRASLVSHAIATTTTSDVDARHDAVFGLSAYCLDVLRELMHVGMGSAILARTGLRTLLECYVTLAYLAHRNEDELWITYRNYGSGQAKLAFLKTVEGSAVPDFLSLDILEMIANEDRWQEFVPINLGHWEKRNLRLMSDTAGVKDSYDQYYPWTSAFLHGNWAAVRNVEFDICANPLHRLHRLLRESPLRLEDVVFDASKVADHVLAIVDQLYPGFQHRVCLPQPGQTE